MLALLTFEVLVIAALAAVLLHTVVNLLTIPRLEARRASPAGRRMVSVLIPARNEARSIVRALQAWARQDYRDYEILVYDDESTDATAALAQAVAAADARIRLIRGGPLPDGWRGKPHACHRLAAQARGAVLVFADADVIPAPDALRATVGALRRLRLSALSALPRHVGRNPAITALVALQNWAALAFVPSWLPRWMRTRLGAAMNGQFVAIRRDVYDHVGGFAAVRGALGEDVALARRLARVSCDIRLLEGSALLRCEAYASVRQAWTANARNLLPVFFGSTGMLLLALGALAAAYLAPFGLLIVGAFTGEPLLLGAASLQLALGVAGRWIADRAAAYPSWLALTHPLAAAALIGMGVASIIGFRWRREIEWRGRRYGVTKAA